MTEENAEITQADMIFGEELAALNGVRDSVLKAVQANATPTAQNIGRQTLDNLDAAALFLQNLGMYSQFCDEQVEKKVKAGDVEVVSGSK